jgi:hypothetical protein
MSSAQLAPRSTAAKKERLARNLRKRAEGQMCASRILNIPMPASIAETPSAPCALPRSAGFPSVAGYFTLVWKKHVKEIRTRRRRILQHGRQCSSHTKSSGYG